MALPPSPALIISSSSSLSSIPSVSPISLPPVYHSTSPSASNQRVESIPVEEDDFGAQPLPWLRSEPPIPPPTAAPIPGVRRRDLAPTATATPTATPSLPIRVLPRMTLSEIPEEEDHENRLAERWEGWNTTTSTYYVTNTDEVPTAVTVYTTLGENPVVDGGVLTVTVYKGADTLTVLGPSYVTLTFYPTTTTFSKTTVSIPTTTKIKTKTLAPASAATATICLPGDASQKEHTGLVPTHDQSITLYVAAIYLIGIAVGWNLFGLRHALYPFKMLVILFHETGHLLMCLCFSVRVQTVCIDPVEGGAVVTSDETPLPITTLPLGLVFSIFIGGLLTYAGFDTLASKIASFMLAPCWIVVFYVGSGVPTKGLTAAAAGLMVGLWWADHAWGLRFYVLFVGVMSSFYILWDVGDDLFFGKPHPCCPTLWANALGFASPMIFTLAFVATSFIFFILFILAGLATWKEGPHAMFCQAQTFLPT